VENIFEFLFKYRPVLFREGDVVLRGPWPVVTLLLAGLAIAAVVGYSYLRPRGRAGNVDRGIMAALRTGALVVVIFCLLQPTLVLQAVVPQRNFVGILIDDSRSMSLPNENGEPRSTFVTEQLSMEGDLMRELSEKFAIRTFAFSSTTGRVTDPTGLTYSGTRTDLAGALDRVREELSAVPLSGIVVVSDGADNGGRVLAESLVPLQAGSIPVFTVGLGEDALEPDVQLDRVQAPRSVLLGSAVVVDVVIGQNGYEGRTVTLEVEDEGTMLTSQQVVLGDDGEPVVTRVRFTADQPGPRRISFRIPTAENERVEGNNRREVLMEVRRAREKILYFEGEPRFEVKFLRRAVEEDENVQVVVLQRTAPDKFLRLDVDDADELAGGFPRTREELFRYRGLILGSVEAGFFTHDQLVMIQDFVSQRGGGLLMLGGRNAFAEGGYAGTPVAEVMPVVLGESSGAAPRAVEVRVTPTPAGSLHPATQIAGSSEAPDSAWGRLPAVTTLNTIVAVKPGATTLLTGQPTAGPGTEQVVLAWQRFGSGKAFALPIQDSWLWQMHAEVPLEDQTHERFWQQLLRGLVDGVQDPIGIGLDRERADPGEPVRVTALVRDSTYIELNNADVSAKLISPLGEERDIPLEWTVEADGTYAGSFVPTEVGTWQVSVTAARGGAVIGSDDAWVQVGPGDDEFFDAARRTALLERIAEATGGQSYTEETVGDLPEDLQYTGGGVTMVEERDLWDMPILFLVLISLIGAEWALRRRRGLV
jgi:uncharacterized membrane protein